VVSTVYHVSGSTVTSLHYSLYVTLVFYCHVVTVHQHRYMTT